MQTRALRLAPDFKFFLLAQVENLASPGFNFLGFVGCAQGIITLVLCRLPSRRWKSPLRQAMRKPQGRVEWVGLCNHLNPTPHYLSSTCLHICPHLSLTP